MYKIRIVFYLLGVPIGFFFNSDDYDYVHEKDPNAPVHTSEFLIFAGSGLLFLALSLPMANIAWTLSLPPTSPTTTISFSEIDDDMRVSYIEVDRYEYICLGSMAKVGTQVLYDPDYPNRCREPEYLWKLGSWERIGLVGWLFGIGGMFYALIAGLFLTGRPTVQKKG